MSRNIPSPKIRALAQGLLAYEEATGHSSMSAMPAILRVSEKLRRPLSTLVGISGFHSLLSRSLTLAKVLEPGLNAVQIKPDGSLEGLSDLSMQDKNQEASVLITAELLELLVTFIGERLMLSLVLDAWPDFAVTDAFEKVIYDPTR